MTQLIKDAEGAKEDAVNILGVPFDGAVLGRKGAAEGPAAIREAMAAFSNYNAELGVGLLGARVFDLGDLQLAGEETLEAHSQIESEVVKDLDPSSLLVVLGGDNSVSLPCLKACAKGLGELGLIVVDSHLDLRGEIGGKPTSGSSYGLAAERVKELDPRRIVEVGIHGFLNSENYFAKARELGAKVMTADEARRAGPEAAARLAYEVASRGSDAVYLSVDLDAVDLGSVSGVSAPSAGGISGEYLFRFLYEVGRRDLVKCADLVELAPSLDATGMSSRVASAALVYLIAGYVSRTKASGSTARTP